MTVTLERVYYAYPTFATWSAFGTVVKPLKPNKNISDKTQAAYTVTVKHATDTDPLLPGQVVRLKFATTSQVEYLVVVDGGKSSSHGEQAYFTHTYTVQELLNITREMHVQLSFFTGANYTPTQFFTRLFALTEKDYAIKITAAALATIGTKWKYADYQVASNSLLDNLVKIGKNNGVRFKMSFDATSATPLQLSCIDLEGTSDIESINGTLVAETTDYKGSNYASKVSAVVQNMASDQYKWWPSMSFTDGARAEPSDAYATETTEDDICLVLPHNIRECTKVRVVGYFSALVEQFGAEGAGTIYYKYFNRSGDELQPVMADYLAYSSDAADQNYRNVGDSAPYGDIDAGGVTEFNVVDEASWLLLDATGTGSQEDTLYFKRGENKIYNIKICQGLGTASNSEWVYEKKIYNSLWVYQSSEYRYQYMKHHLNYYTALCNLYADGEIVASNSLVEDETVYYQVEKRTAFYSQEENQAAGKALAENMQGYVDSMRNHEYEAAYKFNAYADIPALGSIYNGMVLYEIEMDVNVSYIAATLRFSDELVPKSEYLTADNGTQLGAIPLDKAYDRFTNYRTQLWFCATFARAQEVMLSHGSNSYFDYESYADNLMKAFDNGTTLPPLAFDEALLKMGTVYTALAVHSAALGSKVIVNFRTVDNRIVGRLVDESTPTNAATLRFYPVNFCDGAETSMQFKLINPTVRASESNYPAIASATFNAANDIVSVSDSAYYHDVAERPNVTYQMDAKVYNYGRTGKVTQAFWEESCFFRDTFFTADAYTRYLHLDATDTDYEISTTSVTATATDGIYAVNVYLADNYAGATMAGVAFSIFRKLIASPYTEETMVTAIGAITAAATDYVTFYIAFTE